MGRHPVKLPNHLYLSPPPTPPSSSSSNSSSSFSSFLVAKSAVSFTSSAALFQDTSNSALAVRDKIPGLKTSAAFFTTLRANLILDIDSAPTSLTNTPDSLRPTNMASSTGSLPPPSPAPLTQDAQDGETAAVTESQPPKDPLADIPSLNTIRVTAEDDRVEVLHLVADSVAQQRQFASRAVIFHPVTLGILVLIFGLVYQNMHKGAFSDWLLIGTTFVGIVMAVLVSIRWMSGGYIDEAERVGTWKWLDQDRRDSDNSDIVPVGDSDDMLLTFFGDEPIGALIIRGVRDLSTSSSPQKRTRKSQQQSYSNSALKSAPVQGLIRGWTVKNRYRRKGVGTGLLEEAVSLCKERGWTGLEFADDHANSARKLPKQFNAGFASREKKAQALLDKVKQDAGFVGTSDSSTIVSTPVSTSNDKGAGGRKGKK